MKRHSRRHGWKSLQKIATLVGLFVAIALGYRLEVETAKLSSSADSWTLGNPFGCSKIDLATLLTDSEFVHHNRFSLWMCC